MSHENSQFDISGIQLRESRTQPRVSLSREIGEAQITHTIFGRAKVRIIRKGDQARRTMILVAIAVAAVAVVAWQGWFNLQQTEPAQNTAPAPAASAESQASLPASQPESIASLAAPLSVQSEPAALPVTASSPAIISQKIVPQQPVELKDEGQKAVKPVKAQPKPVQAKPKAVSAEPLIAPQNAPVATTNKEILKNQTEMPLAKLSPARRQIMPSAAVPVQTAASSPAVAAVVSPKDDAMTQSPIGDKQMSDPINAPGK